MAGTATGSTIRSTEAALHTGTGALPISLAVRPEETHGKRATGNKRVKGTEVEQEIKSETANNLDKGTEVEQEIKWETANNLDRRIVVAQAVRALTVAAEEEIGSETARCQEPRAPRTGAASAALGARADGRPKPAASGALPAWGAHVEAAAGVVAAEGGGSEQ